MSSTNRSDSRDYHVSDYYVTPLDAVRDFLNAFEGDFCYYFGNKIVLDPCAGGDINHPMTYPLVLREFGAKNIRTIDIREDSLAQIHADYLQQDLGYSPNLIITNPPFVVAESIIHKALTDIAINGFVVMLLRLNFFGGQRRLKEFWSTVGLPTAVYIHPKRLCFTDDGKTDSIEYAHFVWKQGNTQPHCELKLLGI